MFPVNTTVTQFERNETVLPGNTEEFELDDSRAVMGDHPYYKQAASLNTSDGEQEVEQDKSVSSIGHISAAASPTDTSGTPPASPSPSPHNIPENNKYKINMLRRYLNDAAEAAESFSKDRADAERSSLSDQEETAADTDVTTEIIPPASNNITISFTNTNTMVPVISQPPRDEMGVEKVKRHLADNYSLPPQHEFSSSDLGLAASEEVTTLPLSQPLSAPTSSPAPATIFSPLRQLSVLPLTPGPGSYPFFQAPLTTWAPFTPVPHFLHLIPNSSE